MSFGLLYFTKNGELVANRLIENNGYEFIIYDKSIQYYKCRLSFYSLEKIQKAFIIHKTLLQMKYKHNIKVANV